MAGEKQAVPRGLPGLDCARGVRSPLAGMGRRVREHVEGSPGGHCAGGSVKGPSGDGGPGTEKAGGGGRRGGEGVQAKWTSEQREEEARPREDQRAGGDRRERSGPCAESARGSGRHGPKKHRLEGTRVAGDLCVYVCAGRLRCWQFGERGRGSPSRNLAGGGEMGPAERGGGVGCGGQEALV